MRRFTLVLSFGACLFMATGLVSAKDKGNGAAKHTPEEIFAKIDANGDGKVTLDEMKADKHNKTPEMAEKRFKKLDANGDGSVTLDEFKAGAADHGKGGGKKGKN